MTAPARKAGRERDALRADTTLIGRPTTTGGQKARAALAIAGRVPPADIRQILDLLGVDLDEVRAEWPALRQERRSRETGG